MLIAFISLFFSFGFAQVELGFFPPDSEAIPADVRRAKEKIFEIQVPYYETILANDYRSVLAENGLPANGRREVQACIHERKPSCSIHRAYSNGSAFLDKDPQFIWTNCHIVKSWMQNSVRPKNLQRFKEMRAHYRSVNIPLTLKNYQGNLTYSSAKEPAHLVGFFMIGHGEGVAGSCLEGEDIVKIQLHRPLSPKGLAWAAEDPKPMENLFIGGYPIATHSRAGFNRPDSTGKGLHWSYGPFFSVEAFNEVMIPLGLQKAQAPLFVQALLADSQVRMSGGPVLNAFGQVVGTFKGFLQTEGSDQVSEGSLYVDTGGMRVMEIFSAESRFDVPSI